MTTTPTVTVEELRQRAAALVPTLRERNARCEELRRIPEETVADFLAAGLHKACQPVQFGGYGLGIEAIAEIAMEIGRGCGSTAWMSGQWPGHQFMTGYWPLEAQQDYYATGPDTLSSTASAMVELEAEKVEGGVHLKGMWKFSSGCDYADWIMPNVAPYGMCLVPKSDFVVEDDWYVIGLKGTGSKRVRVKDAFVPDHRIVPYEQLGSGTTAGATLYPDNPFYRAPMVLVLNTMLQGPTIGTTRGLLEIFEERALKRTDLHTGKPAYERPGVQLRFAEAAAEVETAQVLLRQQIKDLRAMGEANNATDLVERSRLRRNVAYSAKLCTQATDRLFTSGDASGMYADQDLQRWILNVHYAALQYVLTWDEPALNYSRIRWGLEPEAFTL